MKQVQDPRFRHLDATVGAFVAVSVAALVAAIVYIGIQNNLFTKKYHLRFTVDRGTGFAQGMPVKLSGFRIGRVLTTRLDLNFTKYTDAPKRWAFEKQILERLNRVERELLELRIKSGKVPQDKKDQRIITLLDTPYLGSVFYGSPTNLRFFVAKLTVWSTRRRPGEQVLSRSPAAPILGSSEAARPPHRPSTMASRESKRSAAPCSA